MRTRKFTKLELQILEALWSQGRASLREIQEAFPEPRPAYTTITTTVYRMETNGVMAMPVLGDDDKIVGVVHLHDLMRARIA